MVKIYLVENCYGNPNKVYIGKTKNNRKWNHRLKFGKNIIYTIIDEINSIKKEDWKPLECFWIEQFRQWGFDIQNKNKGGHGSEYYSQEVKNKISKANKGKNKPKSFSKKISKPIIQYDLEGNFIKKWNNLLDIKNNTGFSINTIRECCIKNQIKAYSYLWRYEKENIKKPKPIKRKNRPKNLGCKKVIQLTINNTLIQEYKSLKEAAFKTKNNPKAISACCRGELKTAYGFKWKYKYE